MKPTSFLLLTALLLGSAPALPGETTPPPTLPAPPPLPPQLTRDAVTRSPTSNVFRVAFRVLDGPSVSFANLGDLPPSAVGAPTGIMDRFYADGRVLRDARRDAEGNPIPDDGFTNTWRYSQSSQITDEGNIAFNGFQVSSMGAATETDAKTSMGWEIVYERRFGSFGDRTFWGLLVGAGMADINARSMETIVARLTRTTDVYSLGGATPPAPPYTAPSSAIVDGEVVDTTVLLGNQPISRTTTESETEVVGDWQLKGAYYTFRFGPTLRVHLANRFALQASVGGSASYYGTEFRVRERVAAQANVPAGQFVDDSEKSAWMTSFFAEATAEYWITRGTGIFVGALYTGGGDYSQSVGPRTARLNQGSTVALQGGLVFHF